MQVVQSSADLSKYRSSLSLAEVSASEDDVKQLLAWAVFHHHHEVVGIFIHLQKVHRHDKHAVIHTR